MSRGPLGIAESIAILLRRVTGDPVRIVPITAGGKRIERWTGSKWVPYLRRRQ